jgi:predicted MFS family arabinose efflux permease
MVDRDFVATTAAMTAFFVGVGMCLTLVPRFVVDELGETNRLVGWSSAAYSLAAVACRPLLTGVAARLGNVAVLRAGAVIGVVSLGLHAVAGSTLVLLVVRGVTGLAEAFLYVAAANLVSERAPEQRRAEAISYHSVGLFLALGIGPVIGDLLVEADRSRIGFVVAAGFSLVALACAVPITRDGPLLAGQAAGTRIRSFHRGGALIGVVLALPMFGYLGWSAFLKLRADEVGANAGLLFATYSVIVLVLRLVGARLPERLGLTRTAPLAAGAMAAGLLAAGVIDGAAGLWVSTVGIAVGITLLYPSLIALTARVAASPLERTAAVSTFTMFFEVGTAVGGVALGPVADAAGYQAAYLVGAAVAASGIVVYRTVVLPRIPAG